MRQTAEDHDEDINYFISQAICMWTQRHSAMSPKTRHHIAFCVVTQ